MRLLLDENFPLALYRRLRDSGQDVEHVITLGQRGIGDDALRSRLAREALVFRRTMRSLPTSRPTSARR